MEPEAISGPNDLIQRLLRKENGVRKVARVLLFFDRKQVVEVLIDLAPTLVSTIAREMALLKVQLLDLEEERQRLKPDLEAEGYSVEVLDLSKPNIDGLPQLAGLAVLDAANLAGMSEGLDESDLAWVVMHSPLEASATLLSLPRPRRHKRELLEALTRVPLEEEFVRLPRLVSRVLRQQTSRISKETKDVRDTERMMRSVTSRRRKLSTSLAKPASTALPDAIHQLRAEGGDSLVQQALASVDFGLLALYAALEGEGAQGFIWPNLSARRKADLNDAIAALSTDEIDGAVLETVESALVRQLLRNLGAS